MNQHETKRINIPTELAKDLYANKPLNLSLTRYVIELLKAQSTTNKKEPNK